MKIVSQTKTRNKSENQKLLNAISQCDYDTYNDLCANDLTAFEPESNGMLISGKSKLNKIFLR